MHPLLRASDLDRRRIIDALTTHTAAGRLTLDEFADRVDAVNRSKTFAELAAVTRDLPAVTDGPGLRYRLVAAVVLLLALVLIALLGAAVVTPALAAATSAR